MKSLKYILSEWGNVSQSVVSQRYTSASENVVKPCETIHPRGWAVLQCLLGTEKCKIPPQSEISLRGLSAGSPWARDFQARFRPFSY